MDFIMLTQNSTPIFKWVVQLLGLLMNGIFSLLDIVGIPNIGLAIILFTVVIYMLMTPLTIKQQKFSKLSAKMNPEIQAIQARYKGKNDNDSMMAMNAETKAIYAKYGVSPTGSCLQLAIQMPILFALYRVIYNMPAYVTKVGDAFGVLADKIMASTGGVEYVQSLKTAQQFANNFNIDGNTRNAIIDVLNKVSSTDMAEMANKFGLSDLALNGKLILSSDTTRGLIDHYNTFLGLNIGDTPMDTIKTAFAAGNTLLIVGAVLLPVLSALTQWINVKLMPQQPSSNNGSGNSTADTMAQSMKTMNMVMPLMSAYMCLILPAGMGLYWVAGAVIRSIQQVVVNKHLDKIDIDAVIKENTDKYNEKMKKQGIDPQKLNNAAKMNTKKVNTVANSKPKMSDSEREEAMQKATEFYNNNAKPGSLASKANMVKQYNEKNNK